MVALRPRCLAQTTAYNLVRMIGTVVSHYEIIESLGSGGMGDVYKAIDRRLQRPVALKFLSRDRTGKGRDRSRFMREARAASKLDHPNICTIYEVDDTEDDRPFIAMAFYDGQTLWQLMAKGALPVQRAIEITTAVLRGLHNAHEHGICHRDIKPQNVAITSEDQVKILDFGLARQRGESRITEEGTVVGTPAYMAPELIYDRDVDHRADLWAVGVVLYEMVMQRLPFDGVFGPKLLSAAAREPHSSMIGSQGGDAEALKPVVDRALQKEPAHRYQSALEMIADLENLARRLESPPTTQASIPALAGPSAVVVLPFEDLSPDGDHEYFCTGIAEELNDALGKISGLRVASRSSAAQLKLEGADVRTIGIRLNVGSVLAGSVRKAGNRVRITALLTNVGDGYQLWSERYDRELDDVFTIQEEIAEAIVAKLKGSLAPGEQATLGRRQTENAEAYTAYLKGRHFWNRRTTQALQKGIDYFQEAIDVDTDYARAHAGIADSNLILGVYGSAAPQQVMPDARSAALKAISLDDTLAEAHTSLACVRAVFDWDWKGAEEGFTKAIELDPSYATARQWFAMNFLVPRQRFDEAEEQLRRALALEPISPVIATSLGLLEYYRRDFEAAADQQRATLEIAPNFGIGHFFLGQAMSEAGDHRGGVSEIERALELSGHSAEVIAGLGVAHARAGDIEAATQQLKKLLAKRLSEFVSSTLIAQIYTAMAAIDEALDSLQHARCDRAADLVWIGVRPTFDRLREEKGFVDLMRDIGLPS